MPSSQRFAYIDRLKGFAILLVIMGHVFLFSLHPADDTIVWVIGSFHMPLFMFLSGAVIRHAPSWSKMWEKTKKFLIPFFFFGTLFIFYMKQGHALADFIESLEFILGGSKNGYWYLFSLTFFYFTLMPLKYTQGRWKGLQVVVPLVFFLFFLVGWKSGCTMAEALSLEHAVCFYPFFMLGYFFPKLGLMEKLHGNNWMFTIAIVGYIILTNISADSIPHFVHTIIERCCVPLCAMAVCLYLFERREGKTSFVERQLELIGNETLVIYVLHYFILQRTNLECLVPFFNKGSNIFILVFLSGTTSIVVAYICIGIGRTLKVSSFFSKWLFGGKTDK